MSFCVLDAKNAAHCCWHKALGHTPLLLSSFSVVNWYLSFSSQCVSPPLRSPLWLPKLLSMPLSFVIHRHRIRLHSFRKKSKLFNLIYDYLLISVIITGGPLPHYHISSMRGILHLHMFIIVSLMSNMGTGSN